MLVSRTVVDKTVWGLMLHARLRSQIRPQAYPPSHTTYSPASRTGLSIGMTLSRICFFWPIFACRGSGACHQS